MPSRDLQFSAAAPNGVSASMLKRHKTLPRPREERYAGMIPTPLALKPRVLSLDTGIPSSPTSQSSSPRTLKHSTKRIGVPDLPPTPPTHSRQSSNGNSFFERVESQGEAPESPSLPSTPTNHQSPPTPDVTPPRRAVRSLRIRPSGSDKYLSSRNNSFKTAREDFSSEDDDEVSTVRPILPSARPSEVESPQLEAKKLKPRDIGLGLGLESDYASTPSPVGRKGRGKSSASKVKQDFASFDGGWGSTEELTEVEPEWDHNLMRNVTVRRRRARESHLYNNNNQSDEVVDDYLAVPTNATKLVRKYPLLDPFNTNPLQNEIAESPLLPGFLERPTIAQPTLPVTPDVRRFSEISIRSGTSAVVEAMVVDTLPQRRQTLRHTKKQMGLREVSSDTSSHSSTIDSIFSDQVQHRLVHKTSGIFTRRHHSIGSTPTVNTGSVAKSRREAWKNGSIPVAVVPERQSSTKSSQAPSLRSTSSSRHSKRSMSLNLPPPSQFSTSEPLSFELPKRNPRRLSDYASSAGAHSQRTIDFPPTIPVRRSSLSAPTSRNTSRAASLTAESLKAHDMIQAEAQPGQVSDGEIHVGVQKDSMSLAPPAIVDHNGDPFFGNRLSAQVTPFSQTSYETNCTAAELAQATSVTLHPHHNASVLVVEQQAQAITNPQDDSLRASQEVPLPPQRPDRELPQMNERPHVRTVGMSSMVPVTPPQQQQQLEEADSPLKNPREAPLPPAIKFIPPTPNNLTPDQEEDRQLGDDNRPSTAPEKPKRGLSLLRRALSNRRRSESIISRTFSTKRSKDIDVAPLPPSKASLNSNTVYPSVSDQPADESKLHPFWRPSSFWDDLEDDDYDDYYEPNPYPTIDNRPALPKRTLSNSLKRTFAILPVRDEIHPETYMPQRRTVQRSQSGSLRVVKNRSSSSSLRRALSDGRAYYVTEKSKVVDMDELGRAWESFKGLGRRMSERRRERRSAKLRRTISGPKDAVDGVARVVGGEGIGELGDQDRMRLKGKERA